MFFIFKLFFVVVGFFVLMTVVTGLSLFLRVREQLQRQGRNPEPPQPPPGTGDIIEGEFRVLEEKER